MVYWSRFLRHDGLALLGMLICVYAVLLAEKKFKALLISLGLAIQLCAKENAYVTIAVFSGYLIYEFLFFKIRQAPWKPLLSRLQNSITQDWRNFLFALLFFALFYTFFYTAGFREFGPEDSGLFESWFGSIIDAAYRKSIGYWAGQNEIERIKGPFLFHLHVLSFYELLIVLAYVAHLVFFYKYAEPIIKKLIIILFTAYFGIAIIHFQFSVSETWLGNFFKLKNDFDLFGLFLLAFHPPLLTTDHLIKKQKALAFWGYWFSATFFTYSYLGEKVPWLTIYPLLFGIIYLTLYFEGLIRPKTKMFEKVEVSRVFYLLGIFILSLGAIFAIESSRSAHSDYILIALGLILIILTFFGEKLKLFGQLNSYWMLLLIVSLFNIRCCILTNYTYAGHARELIGQVHTTPEFALLARRIRAEIEASTPAFKPDVLAIGEPTWPLTAYFNRIPQYRFTSDPKERASFDYIFDSYDQKPSEVPEGYLSEKITLRGWWIPDFSQCTLKKFLLYVINHEPWNEPGYSYGTFATPGVVQEK
jgi:uncharacterized protein (TIGR03663 family)